MAQMTRDYLDCGVETSQSCPDEHIVAVFGGISGQMLFGVMTCFPFGDV